ncbi:hypothetical protein E6P97_04525 [Patescibacteria group bacterium]|nr:MAG: hypothetical protein E6P97_04525 [Patescibacteria group bacterium]
MSFQVLVSDFAASAVRTCDPDVCDTGGVFPKVAADSNQVANVMQIVFMVIGIVALIYLIIAGVKLITSLGNPEALKNARQSVIFAAVGLGVALSAELFVTFVLKTL